MLSQWHQFLPAQWPLADAVSCMSAQTQPQVVWACPVSWLSPADRVLSASVSWEHELSVESSAELSVYRWGWFAFNYNALLCFSPLSFNLPCPLEHSKGRCGRKATRRNATWSQELLKFELISFVKEVWPGARCVQVGKREKTHLLFLLLSNGLRAAPWWFVWFSGDQEEWWIGVSGSLSFCQICISSPSSRKPFQVWSSVWRLVKLVFDPCG